MNSTTSGLSPYFFLIFLLGIPFIGAVFLHYLTKFLRFKHTSLKKALLSILITFISYILISILIAVLIHYFSQTEETGEVSTLTVASVTFLTQTVAIKKLFKESTSKTISASMLTTLGVFLVLAILPLFHLVLSK